MECLSDHWICFFFYDIVYDAHFKLTPLDDATKTCWWNQKILAMFKLSANDYWIRNDTDMLTLSCSHVQIAKDICIKGDRHVARLRVQASKRCWAIIAKIMCHYAKLYLIPFMDDHRILDPAKFPPTHIHVIGYWISTTPSNPSLLQIKHTCPCWWDSSFDRVTSSFIIRIPSIIPIISLIHVIYIRITALDS